MLRLEAHGGDHRGVQGARRGEPACGRDKRADDLRFQQGRSAAWRHASARQVSVRAGGSAGEPARDQGEQRGWLEAACDVAGDRSHAARPRESSSIPTMKRSRWTSVITLACSRSLETRWNGRRRDDARVRR